MAKFFFHHRFQPRLPVAKKGLFVKSRTLHPDPLSTAPSEPGNTQNTENQYKYYTKQLQTTDSQRPTPYQIPTNSHQTPTIVGDDRVKIGGWQAGKQPMADVSWQVFLYNSHAGSRSGKQFFKRKKSSSQKKIFNRFWCISMDDFSFSDT